MKRHGQVASNRQTGQQQDIARWVPMILLGIVIWGLVFSILFGACRFGEQLVSWRKEGLNPRIEAVKSGQAMMAAIREVLFYSLVVVVPAIVVVLVVGFIVAGWKGPTGTGHR